MKSIDTWAEKIRKQGSAALKAPPLFHVALVEPEIPQNTGNIGRTCVATHSALHLIGKKGFEITDTQLKRAGLDYWEHLQWAEYADIATWQKQIHEQQRVFYFSAKADRLYTEMQFQKGDWLTFGKETKGLPDELLLSQQENLLLIPLLGPARGLNLATAVAIVLYEAIRQLQARNELDPSYLEIPWGKL